MELAKNDLVVVPGCGVGRVEELETLDVGEGPVEAYRIVLGGDVGRLWVPVDRVGEQGLRPPTEEEFVQRTWDMIREQQAPVKRAHWNKRQRRYREMVMSNQLVELARLIGELAAVQAKQKRENKSPLSFGERRFFEQAKRLFVEEIAASTGEEVDAVAQTLDEVIEAAA